MIDFEITGTTSELEVQELQHIPEGVSVEAQYMVEVFDTGVLC